MKAKHLVALTTLIAVFAFCQLSAQNAGSWQLGITLQPSFFRMYNDYDWEKATGNYPASPNKFNGLSGGLFAEYAVSDYFGLGVELAYSRQHQKYYTDIFASENPDSSQTFYSALSTNVRLDYLKMPLLAMLNLEIGDNSGLFLKVAVGPQISFNMDYAGKHTHYGFNKLTKTIDYDVIVLETTIKPTQFHHDFMYPDGTHYIIDVETEYLFRHFELGVVGGISLQKSIFETYAISVGARYEQGLTDIENPNEDKSYVTLSGKTGFYLNRPATHTRRFVLNIGISKTLE